MGKVFFFHALFTLGFAFVGRAQVTNEHSVARKWNEALLFAIRNDFARPTVHARNLFHGGIAMYDAWAVYDDVAQPYLLGRNINNFMVEFEGIDLPEDLESAREKTISYAAYRLFSYRFRDAPGKVFSINYFDSLMNSLGYDPEHISEDYGSGDPAALGNYIASQIISYGLQDGSNEIGDYKNQNYFPSNNSLIPSESGSQNINNPNLWQPLFLINSIDQAGNEVDNIVEFLSPEWGNVNTFALNDSDKTTYYRDDYEYHVFLDPGPPPYIRGEGASMDDEYQWGHSLVAIWGSNLDPGDSVMWDISPATIGNIQSYPRTIEGLRDFYNVKEGGDISTGYNMNPVTGQPYESQLVPRGDYARVLAEFWADGLDSETPPGHWFTILNYVNDHSLVKKQFAGQGERLNDLEWDVKSYFVLGGAMHDAAISAWSIKGWYDYIRPISAIRFMADQGQSSDINETNYHQEGVPLIDGFIEVISSGDPLAGENDEHVGKIKLYTWRGPDYIDAPETDVAGVGWILAENWWPYQRPSFVTPPFAGYVSGHSTYSRAAAEVLTRLTGDEYFPGGMGEFIAKKNEFLVFEDGPSVDVTLQWAKYKDASDQCSLSRIWGGIHPPADDIPGRLIGEVVGNRAFELAERFFSGDILLANERFTLSDIIIYPNPVQDRWLTVEWPVDLSKVNAVIISTSGEVIFENNIIDSKILRIDITEFESGLYFFRWGKDGNWSTRRFIIH